MMRYTFIFFISSSLCLYGGSIEFLKFATHAYYITGPALSTLYYLGRNSYDYAKVKPSFINVLEAQQLLEKYKVLPLQVLLAESINESEQADALAIDARRGKVIIVKNQQEPLLRESAIGHECGHIVNRDRIKTLITYFILNMIVAYASNKMLDKADRDCLVSQKNLGIFLTNIAISSGVSIIKAAIDTYYEEQADNHSIKYADNPLVLKAAAQFHKKIADLPDSKTSFSFPNNLFVGYPHPLKRAAYFEQAARELEEKLANK